MRKKKLSEAEIQRRHDREYRRSVREHLESYRQHGELETLKHFDERKATKQ